MASRNKHRERSHKTYSKSVNAGTFADFERKAKVQKIRTENRKLIKKSGGSLMQTVKEKLFKHQSK